MAKTGKLDRVLRKGTKNFHPGLHVAGPGILLRIELAIGLRDRFRGIGGKVVPEMFEINSLAAGDQRQRRLAEEMEVPEIAQQKDVIPVADAGEERFHQHDPVDFVGYCAA